MTFVYLIPSLMFGHAFESVARHLSTDLVTQWMFQDQILLCLEAGQRLQEQGSNTIQQQNSAIIS